MELDAILDNLSDEEQIELLELLEEEENYRNTHCYMNLRHTANSVSSSTPGMTIQSAVLWLVTSLVSHLLVLPKSRFTLPGVIREQKAIRLMVNMAGVER
ncbi:hypothetical protein DMI62_13565 [Escherichia coli]|nr:hypothetical protein [Escherichia coli]